MIELAKKYEMQLKQIFYDTALDGSFCWEWIGTGREWIEPSDKTWEKLNLVSTFNGNILGEMGYQIDGSIRCAHRLYAAHFSKDNGYIFMKDLITCVKNIFEKYGLSKCSFSVILGNPAERIWDKLVLNFGGRIIGYREEDVCLENGKLYDVKEYEIMAKNYFKATKHLK
jgi:hypothetical protein